VEREAMGLGFEARGEIGGWRMEMEVEIATLSAFMWPSHY
jgi:hypothetical protein